jgi:hypothetical protein
LQRFEVIWFKVFGYISLKIKPVAAEGGFLTTNKSRSAPIPHGRLKTTAENSRRYLT